MPTTTADTTEPSPDGSTFGGTAPAVAATVMVTLGGALGVFLTGAVSVQIDDDLGFGPAELGIGTLVFFAASALGSPPAGQLAQRRGNRFGMRLAAASALIAACVIGTAANTIQVFVGLVFAGLASASAAPSCNALLAEAVSLKYRALAFGVKQSAVPLATFFGGLAVPIIALTVGWRFAYVIPVVVALVALTTVPDVAKRTSGRAAGTSAPLRGAAITVLAVSTSLGSAAGTAVGAFIVPALVDGGISEGSAGRAAAIGAGTTVVARIFIGALQDRLSIEPLRIVATVLGIGTIAFCILATGPDAGLEFLVPLAFVGSWGWPGLYSYAVVQAFPAAPAAASGYTQAGAFSGAAIGPFIFGLVAEGASYDVAFGFLAALTAASAVGMMTSAVMLRRRPVGAVGT